ncbi:hypothetical protein LshimejAT787_1402550 [Lyophyllum shimeji]|uniref:Uncharacterized protein n=1 Tax=Lyophyllum shimeji TaxID=47721 RepID=A0A9P3PY69_LYOSH|nr:hypothetical protein LshimejAT787_1402550 [Lyophyllum shimeji]
MLDASDDEYVEYDLPEFTEDELLQIDADVSSQFSDDAGRSVELRADEEYAGYFSEFTDDELLQVDADVSPQFSDDVGRGVEPRADEEYAEYFSEFTDEELLQIDADVSSQLVDDRERVERVSPAPDGHGHPATSEVSSHSGDASALVVDDRRPQVFESLDSSCLIETVHTIKTEPGIDIQRPSLAGPTRSKRGAATPVGCSDSKASVKSMRTRATSLESDKPLRAFFQKYAHFVYNPTQPPWDEFNRLARSLHWFAEGRAIKKAEFKVALVKEFNCIYGTDESDIESWQMLCRVIGITPLPEGLKACREAVDAAHVNLVDLVDVPNSGRSIKLFDSEESLSRAALEKPDCPYWGPLRRLGLTQYAPRRIPVHTSALFLINAHLVLED